MNIHNSVNNVLKVVLFNVYHIQIMAEQLALLIRQLPEYALLRLLVLIFLKSWYDKVTICSYH